MTPQKREHKTECRICHQHWDHDAIAPFVLNGGVETPQARKRLEKFVTEFLAAHIAEHHREEMRDMLTTAQDVSGLLIVNHYESTDPSLNKLSDRIRGDLHRKTQKNFVTDDGLRDVIARLGLDTEHEQSVFQLMQGMRDAYEERGEYSHEKQQSRLIVPA